MSKQTPSLTDLRRSRTSLVKLKKPSHDIFNKVYMEDMLGMYEEFVNKLSSFNIYYEIIPKRYQREYQNQPFGEAFSKTPGRTFSRTFGRAFHEHTVYPEQYDSKWDRHNYDCEEYNFHPAFDTARRYGFAGSCMAYLKWDMACDMAFNGELEFLSERLRKYNKETLESNEQSLKPTALVNNVRIYRASLELLHWGHMATRHKLSLGDVSSDAKRYFRESKLATEDQHIDMLEKALLLKTIEQNNRKAYATCCRSLKEKCSRLTKEVQSLRAAVRRAEDDEGDEKSNSSSTGLFEQLLRANEATRDRCWQSEADGMRLLMTLHYRIIQQKNIIVHLKSRIKRLYDSVKTKFGQPREMPTKRQVEIYDQLNFMPYLSLVTEENIEDIVPDLHESQEPSVSNLTENMLILDEQISVATAAGFVKKKKEMQEQDRKIDQLETQIIRHIIDRPGDIQDKECVKTNSTCSKKNPKGGKMKRTTSNVASDENVTNHMEHVAIESVRNVCKKDTIEQEYDKNLLEFKKTLEEKSKLEKENVKWKKQLTKLRERRRAWLKKRKPDEEDWTKYEMILDALINNSLKRRSAKETSDDANKRERMRKASLQALELTNNLTLELSQVDENLNEMFLKYNTLYSKFSMSRADSDKICDACKSYQSKITECTKYTTHMVYEDNLMKFYMTTTVMDQLSFILYMIRTPLFKRHMSPRNQWSIKQLIRKLIVMRNRLKKKMGIKIDAIDFPTPDEPKSHTTDISMSISNTDKTSSINIDENSSSDDIEYYVDKTDTDQSDDQDISKEHADFTSSEKRDDNDENCNGS